MARNRVHIDAPVETVWAVLCDPYRYPDWVVGAADVRDHDGAFPAPGSRFHHRVGLTPVALNDHTEVLEVDPPRRIALKAKARPLGTARIDIELAGQDGGTQVTMDERPGDLLTRLIAGNPLADAALCLRNAQALARLRRTVEADGPGARGTARPAR